MAPLKRCAFDGNVTNSPRLKQAAMQGPTSRCGIRSRYCLRVAACFNSSRTAAVQSPQLPVHVDVPLHEPQPGAHRPLPATDADATTEQQQQQPGTESHHTALHTSVTAIRSSNALSVTGSDADALPPPFVPWRLLSCTPLAGGMLHVVAWREDGRCLRVWMPPGYTPQDAQRHPLPLLLLNDGQNLFDPRLSLSGTSWQAAEAAAEAISTGALPPFVVAGIDHAGPQRSYEYLPCVPGDAGGMRLDAAQWPGGGVADYTHTVVHEILPYLTHAFGASTSPALRAFGGSSFGGIAALCMGMMHPGVFGGLLVESPSLWIDEGRFLREDVASHRGPWPSWLWLAQGSVEYSGLRGKGKQAEDFDAALATDTEHLAGLLAQQSSALASGGLACTIHQGATHTEAAWASRMPNALRHLCSTWWAHVAESEAHGRLYFTLPRRLRGGQQALLFFNQSQSHPLVHATNVEMSYGFNHAWSMAAGRVSMQPALHLQAHAAAGSKWLCARVQVPTQAYEMHMAFAGRRTTRATPTATSHSAAGSTAGAGASPQLQRDAMQAATMVPGHAPSSAVHEGEELWDNNDGNNFYARVVPDPSCVHGDAPWQEPTAAVEQANAWGDVQDLAHRQAAHTYFTTPPLLRAGTPTMLYVNRARLAHGLSNSPNVRVHVGFNDWRVGVQHLSLLPSSLWRGEGVDWWCVPLTPPADAHDMEMAFTDGQQTWDSNDGLNYCVPLQKGVSGGADGMQGSASANSLALASSMRGVTSEESYPHAGGMLHILNLAPYAPTHAQGSDAAAAAAAARASRWCDERRVRVWTPPGYSREAAPPGGWPVLYMHDGQNMFEDWLAHQGVSWNVAHTASHLIGSGVVPPFVVVAVDSAGAMRSRNYLPYAPGTGVGGFRGDCERWPGGGLAAYMQRYTGHIMPLVQARYGLTTDAARVAMGGGSFAGVTALYAAMHYPHVFGSVLVESPSLWIAEGQFLRDLEAHTGMLPERLFMGCGTAEYSATREGPRPDVDALLLSYCEQAVHMLREQGMRGPRLVCQVEPGAGHHEGAWRWRLQGALEYLLGGWGQV